MVYLAKAGMRLTVYMYMHNIPHCISMIFTYRFLHFLLCIFLFFSLHVDCCSQCSAHIYIYIYALVSLRHWVCTMPSQVHMYQDATPCHTGITSYIRPLGWKRFRRGVAHFTCVAQHWCPSWVVRLLKQKFYLFRIWTKIFLLASGC